MLVLGGALAAGHRHRVYDAVILKTLGATGLRLLGSIGVIAGSIAAWLIVTRMMTLSFIWQGQQRCLACRSRLVVTVDLGLTGTLLALNQKPASVLRNL